MIKEFSFDFDELAVIKTDLEELMGFDDEIIPEPFPELIETVLKKAPGISNIKGGFKIYDNVKIDTLNQNIQIEDVVFNPSKVVVTQLRGASSIAIFLCTAGHEISEYAKNAALESDPLMSYVIDVLGSVTVEKAMDKIQQTLEEDCKNVGLGITDRFSPGYCEWSVGEQQQLFSLVPENFCGIKLSNSSLMSPIKSVSGIIGLGKGLKKKGYQCNWCTDTTCIYGKIKRNKNAIKK